MSHNNTIIAMTTAALGATCYQHARALAAAKQAPEPSAPDSAREALWARTPALETPRGPPPEKTPEKGRARTPPGTPSRGTPSERLWGQSGAQGAPSPRPTRSLISRPGAAKAGGVSRASHKLYIGCYTEKQWWVAGSPGEGLYVFDFDAETGGLSLDQVERTVVSPSWTVVHPSRNFLFVVTEKGPDDSEADSLIVSYAIGEGGALTMVGSQPTGGLGANCVACVGETAVVCTNYFTGSLASFRVEPSTGVLGPAKLYPGRALRRPGPIEDRQDMAHPHDLFVRGSQLFTPVHPSAHPPIPPHAPTACRC